MKFSIPFQNEHIIVVDKPHGWLTTPARFKTDQRPCLGPYLEKELSIRLWPVHRLDYEVSGLVIFAKSAQVHKVLSQCFEKNQIEKQYEVWTEKFKDNLALPQAWTLSLVEGKKRTFEAPHGRVSKTIILSHKYFLWQNQEFSRWLIQIETGRRHQIRATFKMKGYPILGDQLYGEILFSELLKMENFICLRAIRLGFDKDVSQSLNLPSYVEVSPLDCYLK